MSRLRLATLWCPNWPVAVAAAEPGEAVVVVHANRVLAVSRAAAGAGVEMGMRRRQAQGRCPGARIVAHDGDRDGRMFEAVARAVGQLVARLEVTEPGMITFQVKGPARYFGGELEMAGHVVNVATAAVGPSLAEAGGFGVGIGDGRFVSGLAARRAARLGQAQIVASGSEATAAALAEVPIDSLAVVGGVDVELVGLLRRLGLTRLGDFAALDEGDVIARFGRGGQFAHQLARGDDERIPDAVDPPTGVHLAETFDEPVQHTDIVVFCARRLAEQLVGGLAAEGRVCTRLMTVIETEHGERSERCWYRPTGLTGAAIVERVRWQLDGWVAAELLTAGVSLLRLEPVELRPDHGVQHGMWGGRTQADDWAARAIARMTAIAGEDQIMVPVIHGGRMVDERFGWVPVGTVELFDSADRVSSPPEPWPGRGNGPAPTVVHRPARPLAVADADGHPVHVSGRGLLSGAPTTVVVAGQCLGVVAWAGPWPVDQHWWDAVRHRRAARFQLLTVTNRLLEASIEQRQWWLLGEHA